MNRCRFATDSRGRCRSFRSVSTTPRRWAPNANGYVFGSRNWYSFRSAWEAALDAAGIEGFRFHDLRRTFASWLVQDGVSLDRVSKLLGHKSLTMTMRYAHLGPNQLHEDVALLTRNSTPVAPEPNRATTTAANYVN